MAQIFNPEVLEERARNLGSLNGFKLVFVTLDPPGAPTHALLDVEFHNNNELANILNDVNVNAVPPTQIFPISGGTRILAGDQFGQVQVVAVAAGGAANVLRLTVQPIGDYSTYKLRVVHNNIDPIFSEIAFKFRPGCFNLNCAPEWTPAAPLADEPAIDYLAKDYDSFKHVLIAAMQRRVPGWQPTSEADLDQVLIDLIAADADEISDFQDRVVNEGYLARARKRLSLARHARLMDYHIHQGNQATTWLAVKVNQETDLPDAADDEFGMWTGKRWEDSGSVIFAIPRTGERWRRRLFPEMNDLRLYTWSDAVTALAKGSTEAELTGLAPLTKPAAEDLCKLFLRNPEDETGPATHDEDVDTSVDYLLIEEGLNPETGAQNGRNIGRRQLLRLVPRDADPPRAEVGSDPMTGEFFVKVRWIAEDALKENYCFVALCGAAVVRNITAFYGNLARIAHGRPHVATFRPPGLPLAGADASNFVATSEAYYEATKAGVVCVIPQSPLAYRNTEPGGEKPTRSSLKVTVGGFGSPWEEQSDLIESESDDEHFIVETDEYKTSRVRFGNDLNGRALPANAVVTCAYQVGQGEEGNVGADTLTGFDEAGFPKVTETWNPFDVVDGRDPEPVAEIVRRVPEAYRQRQLRAVTLEDYVKRAEELPLVAHAAAKYAWTGSWRAVRIAIDPQGTTILDDMLRVQIENYLNAVRLIGEDLEIRPAQYVPLDIFLRVCAHPDYWPADLDAELQQEFSDGYTPAGQPGFFHPDSWTFGQPLYASQLIGRALSVVGVERVLFVSIRRLHALGGPSLIQISLAPEDVPQPVVEKLDVDTFEVIEVANDPSALESGRIRFEIKGGRQ